MAAVASFDDAHMAAALANGNAVAVVIDMQNDFCHPQGAMAALGADVTVNCALVEPVRDFVEAVRAVGGRTLFVRLEHTPEHRPLPAPGVPPDGVCAAGSWGAQLVFGLAAQPGDLSVTKTRYSAFLGTDLEAVLRANGIDALVVTGTTANVCVDSTVRDAAQRGFTVWVLSDLVGYVRADLAEPCLRNLGLYFADVRTSAGLIAALVSAAGRGSINRS